MRALMEKRLPKFVDPVRAASRRESFEGSLAAQSITRLGTHFRCESPVSAAIRFANDGHGRVSIVGTVRTELLADCQRCLRPVVVAVEQNVALLAVDANDGTDGELGDDDDTVEYCGKLDLHELIEDELILAVPIVPQHAQGECAMPADVAEAHFTEGKRVASELEPRKLRKPFAGLAELMKNEADS
ncbi:MAG: YceD family protein [Pseudomonadota bacterium]